MVDSVVGAYMPWVGWLLNITEIHWISRWFSLWFDLNAVVVCFGGLDWMRKPFDFRGARAIRTLYIHSKIPGMAASVALLQLKMVRKVIFLILFFIYFHIFSVWHVMTLLGSGSGVPTEHRQHRCIVTGSPCCFVFTWMTHVDPTWWGTSYTVLLQSGPISQPRVAWIFEQHHFGCDMMWWHFHVIYVISRLLHFHSKTFWPIPKVEHIQRQMAACLFLFSLLSHCVCVAF